MSAFIHTSSSKRAPSRAARAAILPALALALSVPAFGQEPAPPPPSQSEAPAPREPMPAVDAAPALAPMPPMDGPGPGPGPGPALAPGLGRAARQGMLDKETDPARRALLQGKFFVDDSQWAKAIEQLGDFMKKYPKDRSADQALFYYAFSLKKLSKYDDSWRALERFAADFPKSRWMRDARALQIELAPILGKQSFIAREAQETNEDELKCAVLQSLAHSNAERAREAARDLLKPGSPARQPVKQCALIVLGQIGGDQSRAILLEAIRNGSDPELQRSAIRALGFFGDGGPFDDATFNALRGLAMSSQNADLARTALMALSHGDDPRVCQLLTEMATTATELDVRRNAIMLLGHQDRCASFETLERIFATNTDDDIRRFALISMADSDSSKALDLLLRVAQGDQSLEMRRFALIQLADRDPGRAVQVLVQMYDSEQNETIKEQVIASLGQIEDRRALEKLIKIAREDPSMEMRKKAIFWVGQSNDPEATRLLEEILK